VTAADVVARVVVFPPLRAVEAAVAGAALVAAAVAWAVARPGPDEWRAKADETSGEPGVFSAAASSPAARLHPLVAHRAELAAAIVLVGPRERRPLAMPARVAVLGLAVALVAWNLPGRKSCTDGLPIRAMQALLLEEVRALQSEGLTGRNEQDAAVLDQAADRFGGQPLTAEAAQELARRLKEAARGSSSRTEGVAEALAKNALFRDLAQALRHQDPAAVSRALESLARRAQALDPRSKEALESAASLLNVAAAESDPLLRKALADAGRALSGEAGSDSVADSMLRLGPPLQRILRFSESVRDVAVLLDSAVSADRQRGDLVPVPVALDRARARTAAAGAPGSLPGLADYRSLVRPGTADETVLRRYFAVQ
jgi:hypothetical protein